MIHPVWCERAHGTMPVHSGQVGADLELTSELAYGVFLFQQENEPAEVQIMRHTPDETAFTRLSVVEASIMRDLLAESLSLLAAEVGR